MLHYIVFLQHESGKKRMVTHTFASTLDMIVRTVAQQALPGERCVYRRA